MAGEKKIHASTQEIESMHEQIKVIKEKAESIGSEKIRLEDETKNLRAKRQDEVQQLKDMQEDLLATQ